MKTKRLFNTEPTGRSIEVNILLVQTPRVCPTEKVDTIFDRRTTFLTQNHVNIEDCKYFTELAWKKAKKIQKKCIRLAAYTHFLPCPDARPKGWRGWSPRLSPTSGEVLPGHFLHFAIENGHREFVDLPSYKIFKNCDSLPEGNWFDIHVTSCNPLDIGLHQRFGLSHIGRNKATAIAQALADHLWNSLETWLFPDHWGWYMSFWGILNITWKSI